MRNKNIKFYRQYVSLMLLIIIGTGSLMSMMSGCNSKKNSDNEVKETTEPIVAINNKVSKLVGENPKYIKVADIAETIHDNILEGNFSAAEQRIHEVYDSSHQGLWGFEPYTLLITTVQRNIDDKYEHRLQEWIEINQSNPLPWLLRAQYLYEIGWLERGGGKNNKIDEETIDAFRQLMFMAAQDIETAIKFEPKNRYSRLLQFNILSGGEDLDEIAEAFKSSIEIVPDYYPLYQQRLSTLAINRGGSFKAMYKFVDTHAGAAELDSPLRLLYLELYKELLWYATNRCQMVNDEERDSCVTGLTEKIVTPSLFQNVIETITAYKSVDRWDYSKAIGDILRATEKMPDAGHFAGVILQLVAESMDSNPELTPDEITNNNYMIDRTIGVSWLNKGNYTAAETMLLRAVKDLDNIEAPNDEFKNYERAMIYDNLARLYYNKKDYETSVAYSKAAEELAGVTRSSYGTDLQCYALYSIKLYQEAIKVCTEAFEKNASSYSLYLRGRTHLALGDEVKAIEDYRRIADSEMPQYRADAAFGIEYIYSKRRDFEKMLEVLEQYPYLYDEHFTSKKQIAIAYNNRCYAKKKLGRYQEALEDCNASLKYDQIPDAYQKQRELVKILKPI